uniref:Uncharacterized protein n=1 Tax=Felis catus TaxID=9685 RepID=A0ABI7ZAE2_FELCA
PLPRDAPSASASCSRRRPASSGVSARAGAGLGHVLGQREGGVLVSWAPVRHVFRPAERRCFPVRKWPGSFGEPGRRGLGGGAQADPERLCAGREAMASGSNWLSGVNVVLVMAYGSLVFVLLFIFVKRQIMRFAMKSRRGPHVPVGHNAPKSQSTKRELSETAPVSRQRPNPVS